MMDIRQCEVCYREGSDIERGWARYREGKEPYQIIDRCVDRAACRQRVQERGDVWPLEDPRPKEEAQP